MLDVVRAAARANPLCHQASVPLLDDHGTTVKWGHFFVDAAVAETEKPEDAPLPALFPLVQRQLHAVPPQKPRVGNIRIPESDPA